MAIPIDDYALPQALATDATTAVDEALFRIETGMNLLLLAKSLASSMGSDARSEHDRLQAGLLGVTLDEALAEQRVVWLGLASTMAPGLNEPHRYRDVTHSDQRQRGRNTRSKR